MEPAPTNMVSFATAAMGEPKPSQSEERPPTIFLLSTDPSTGGARLDSAATEGGPARELAPALRLALAFSPCPSVTAGKSDLSCGCRLGEKGLAMIKPT